MWWPNDSLYGLTTAGLRFDALPVRATESSIDHTE
jgi:hypothetical protein